MTKITKKEDKEKKVGKGRPKGSQSLGIPIKTLKECLELIKSLWSKVESKVMSSAELTEHLNLKKGSNTPVIGALNDYGLIERVGDGWRISELGRRAMSEDTDAINEAFEKNQIFKELSIAFGDKDVTQGMILNFIKKKYKKGGNAITIANRFTEIMEYIKSFKKTGVHMKHVEPSVSYQDTKQIARFIRLIQLNYALEPPLDKKIEDLVDEVCEDFKDGDIAIQTLLKSIKENKQNKEILKVLVKNIINILSEKYPDLSEIKSKKR